jgi:hypothetical protein
MTKLFPEKIKRHRCQDVENKKSLTDASQALLLIVFAIISWQVRRVVSWQPPSWQNQPEFSHGPWHHPR